jgi:AcrR family transcriptional regulator
VTSEILAAARHQLAQSGAAALSLRAIARELGMASSAIYRYFPSRDDLLTRLIIEAYESVGQAAQAAHARASEESTADQLRGVWRAVRGWALTHPHEYALIFGSPVPGYRAPQDTILPATMVPWVLLEIVSGSPGGPPATPEDLSPGLLADALSPLRSDVPTALVDDPTLLVALTSWATLFGAISFELFGHTHNVIAEDSQSRAAIFDAQVDLMLFLLGIDPAESASRQTSTT